MNRDAKLPRVFVALDFPTAAEALALAGRLSPRDCGVKIGKELFVSAGPDLVRQAVDRGFAVFIDLKFHDIPNTVAGACAAAERNAGGTRPLLIAVTVLTSLTDADMRELGIAVTAQEHALRLARLTRDCGLDGVVCSAQEAQPLRAACGPAFKLVTPGIRPADAAKDDQARIVTPQAAVRNGADYLVVGRPITQAHDPVAALAAINAAIAS